MYKVDKSDIVYSENIVFFTSDENDLYFFTLGIRGCFGNFPEKMWNAPFLFDIAIPSVTVSMF